MKPETDPDGNTDLADSAPVVMPVKTSPSTEVYVYEQAPRPHKWFTFALFLLLLVTVAGRFVALDADPPFDIVSDSGAFITDEGWYGKSAQLRAKFGEWTNEYDLVWYSHNPLFTVIQTEALELLGISLRTARLVSVLSFLISIVSLYLICRTTQPRVIAILTCLLVSVTLHNVAYSRLALIEPVGVAITLVALLLWVRSGRTYVMTAAAIVVAAAALFIKVSFLYAPLVVGVLILGDAVLLFRRGERAKAVVFGVITAVALAAMYVGHLAVVAWAAEDGRIFQTWHVTGRVEGIRVLKVIQHELKMLYKITYATGAPTLTCVLGFGILYFFLKRRFRLEQPIARATVAMVLWGLAGAGFFGLFRYQPPRYYYFALFPLIYCTVMVSRYVVGSRNWRLASLFLLFVHLAVQFPGYRDYLRRDRLRSASSAARDIVEHLEFPEGEDELVVMGGTASFVGFFDGRIRPIEFRWHDFLEERIRRWRPPYMIAYESEIGRLAELLPHMVERVERIKSYEVMYNYYTEEDMYLCRIEYRDG